MIDKKTVHKVSKLAHLKIQDTQVPHLVEQFENILTDFRCLQEVGTEGVEPMLSPVVSQGSPRKDVVIQEADVEDILANAPEKKGALFKVPPVV